MWPSSYPECSPAQVDRKTYDYIIVGGGTAGCVLASRLSEDPEVTVLVLEKGGVRDNMVSRMPLLSQNMFMGDTLQVQSTRWSEPIPEANGRKTRLWTAEGMGGATRINAMLLTRGCHGDYVAWSDELGLDDWDWNHVEPHFRAIENAVAHPASKARGHEGPVEVRQLALPFKWVSYLEKAAQKVGLSVANDCNDPAAPAMGFFYLDAAIDKQGRRISSYNAFLSKKTARQRIGGLTVCTGTVASRLEIDDQSGIISGVRIRSSQKPANTEASSKEYLVKARREVILCSGAICTPQLLLLSGIGPREQNTEGQNSMNITIVKELPAVGARLADHYSFPIMLELPKKETFHILESLWGLWYILVWVILGTGLMGVSAAPSTIYIRTDAIDAKTMTIQANAEDGSDNMDASQPRNIPDTEIMIFPINGLERHVPGHSLFSLYPTLIQPHARGRIELASTDPLANPRITHPMLIDERDLAAARVAVRFTMRLAEEFQNSGYPYPAPFAFAPGNNLELLREWEKSGEVVGNAVNLVPDISASTLPNSSAGVQQNQESIAKLDNKEDGNKTWKNVTDREIDDYIRRVSHTSLHFSCTCPMSNNDEKSGVVDQKLRVYGFKNLRIADASVFPRVPSGHTMAPVMMVAERCADFIKKEWNERRAE